MIVASLGIGAFYLRALLVPGWTGALGRLAEFVLGLSALVVIAELIGLVGLLEELPLVLACAIVGLGTAFWARPRVDEPEHGESPAVRSSTVMLVIAVAASALVVAHWAEPTQEALDTGMYYQDTTWYHMSFSGRFAQTGEVGPLHLTDPLKLTAWYYPQNSELLHAIPMVAMDTDFLSPLINLGWLAVALLAAWCIGRPYAVGTATLLGAAVVLDSEMFVGSQAGNAPNDIAGLFFLLCVIAFLVNGAATARATPRIAGAAEPPPSEPDPEVPLAADGGPGFDPKADEDHPQQGVVTDVPVAGDPRVLAGVGSGPLLLAGLAAGLGIGTKITLLAAIGFLTLGVAYLGGREGWWKALGFWLGGMLVTAGFWYGRNLFFALNPFPQIEKIGPINLPGPDQGGFYPREPHSLSEYYNDPGVWEDYFFPPLKDGLGPLWPLIFAFVAAGLVFAFFRGGSKLMRVLAATGIFAAIAYVFTPLTASGWLGQPTGFEANLRYVAPAMIIGLTITPLVPALRRRPWPWILIGVFGLFILQGTLRFGIDRRLRHRRLSELELRPPRRIDRARPALGRRSRPDRRRGQGRDRALGPDGVRRSSARAHDRDRGYPARAVPGGALRGQRGADVWRPASARLPSGRRCRCSGRAPATLASAWSGARRPSVSTSSTETTSRTTSSTSARSFAAARSARSTTARTSAASSTRATTTTSSSPRGSGARRASRLSFSGPETTRPSRRTSAPVGLAGVLQSRRKARPLDLRRGRGALPGEEGDPGGGPPRRRRGRCIESLPPEEEREAREALREAQREESH